MDALLASELHQLALHQASASDLASSDPLPDAALCNLDFLLSEPALLELALDALDGGRVLRVRGVGGSIVWQVVSSMVGRRGSRSGAPPRSGVVDGADLSGSDSGNTRARSCGFRPGAVTQTSETTRLLQSVTRGGSAVPHTVCVPAIPQKGLGQMA